MAARQEPVLLAAPACMDVQASACGRAQHGHAQAKLSPGGLAAATAAFSNLSASSVSAPMYPMPGSEGEGELLAIMARPADAAPSASWLGISPPVRSGCYGGAANPWSHDRSWKKSAYSASSTNLAALRELDSEGEPFLRARNGGAAAVVLGGCTLPVAAPAPVAPSGTAPPTLGSNNSSTGAEGEVTPFTCHTAYFLG